MDSFGTYTVSLTAFVSPCVLKIELERADGSAF